MFLKNPRKTMPTLNAKSSQKYLLCYIRHSREFLSGISTDYFFTLDFFENKVYTFGEGWLDSGTATFISGKPKSEKLNVSGVLASFPFCF